MMSEDGNYLSSCGLSAVLGVLELLKLTLTEEEIMVQEASFGARLFEAPWSIVAHYVGGAQLMLPLAVRGSIELTKLAITYLTVQRLRRSKLPSAYV